MISLSLRYMYVVLVGKRPLMVLYISSFSLRISLFRTVLREGLNHITSFKIMQVTNYQKASHFTHEYYAYYTDLNRSFL